MDSASEAATAAFNSDQPTPERRCPIRRWDVDHVWHGFTQMAEYANAEPLVIDRAEGCWLIDVAGRRDLDGVASLWCNVHGHRRAEIDDAVRLQTRSGRS